MTRYTRHRRAEFEAAAHADQDSGVLSWSWIAAMAAVVLPAVIGLQIIMARGAAC
jgi:hypothetical protein